MSRNLIFIQPMVKHWRMLTAIVAAIVIIASSPFGLINTRPAVAQIISTSDIWQQVYQKLPDFPLENNYVNKEARKVDRNDTLAGRLIRYHFYVKGRAPNYRLDWKLSLADYLGANEPMYDTTYPGSETLQKNPLNGDRAAIAKLNRRQRDALVQVLVDIFTSKQKN